MTIGYIKTIKTMPKIMQMKTSDIPVAVSLTKNEVESLKQFCDENLAVGTVIITQSSESGIGFTTKVMVKDLPETTTDITDIDSW